LFIYYLLWDTIQCCVIHIFGLCEESVEPLQTWGRTHKLKPKPKLGLEARIFILWDEILCEAQHASIKHSQTLKDRERVLVFALQWTNMSRVNPTSCLYLLRIGSGSLWLWIG